MEQIITVVYIILLIAVRAWREVQILIDRDSWKYRNLKLHLYWEFNQSSKEKFLWIIPKKNLDSFHVSNGFGVLLICFGFVYYEVAYVLYVWCEVLTHILNTIAYWLVWMQIRNLFMYLIYDRKAKNV